MDELGVLCSPIVFVPLIRNTLFTASLSRLIGRGKGRTHTFAPVPALFFPLIQGPLALLFLCVHRILEHSMHVVVCCVPNSLRRLSSRDDGERKSESVITQLPRSKWAETPGQTGEAADIRFKLCLPRFEQGCDVLWQEVQRKTVLAL